MIANLLIWFSVNRELRPAIFDSGVINSHVHVEQVSFHGKNDAYRISNDTVELVVVPRLGRVMRYAYLRGENVLWENVSVSGGPETSPNPNLNWINYGGDKLWVAPQSIDTWPPDHTIDPGPYAAEILPNGIRLQGAVSAALKVRLSRDIVLSEFGTKVSFTNRLQNLGEARRICPWQVTQIDNPDVVELPVRVTGLQPAGYYSYGNQQLNPKYHDLKVEKLLLRRDPLESRKFGATGLSGELLATKHGVIFHSFQSVSARANYPDNGSAQQVYLSADPLAYVELEQVGPLTKLERREYAIQRVQWTLSDK